ncbi:MAG: NAD-dependent epimerase/dehydratase family protein [Bradyrhizobium sp.]|jgi:dihydroflavonol-4-reductase
MTKVLVTGGSGFIGQHLVSALVAGGGRVRVLDVRGPRVALPEVEYVAGTVLDRNLVDSCLSDVDQVYHLAGLPGMWLPNKADFHEVNCCGTEVVIAAARNRGVARFLHCSTESILFPCSSSDEIAGEETLRAADDMPGPYTRSKMLAERTALQAAKSGFPVVIGTPTMPIGPHDYNLTPPTAMLRHFLRGRLQLYLNFVVNLVDVRDVAAGLVLAMQRGQVGHRYLLGGESLRLKRILQLLAATIGESRLQIPVPGATAKAAATVLEFIADHATGRPPSATTEGVRIALRASALSIQKAERELGYAPRPVEPALRETLAHLLKAGHLVGTEH